MTTSDRRSRVPAFRFVILALAFAVAGSTAGAQQAFDYNRGQNVQPAYEGWERNPDGSFSLVFGYYNRNWEEEPNIQVGSNNFFAPGPEDQGQPTHFYPRRQMYVFKVRVPADFGNKELTWTVTHNGRTDKAVGWLGSFYEIDNTVLRAQRTGSQRESTPEEVQARPPSIEAEGSQTLTATTGQALPLAVLVKDDGLPGPREQRHRLRSNSNLSVTFTRDRNAATQDMVSAMNAMETGLAVTFIHYRGPGTVSFDPMTSTVEKTGGRAATAVTFHEPGTYVIRAVVDDQMFTAPAD
ncbi:MAG: hypothetical protein FJW23_16365, partial [Acidimicrobiia bacterium]|nr:hypothetical protein [Acidimicrobiia bacterium]